MPEYRAVRDRVPFLELCKRPELATEVTVTAAERLGVDAAILFADILLILEPLGFELEFAKGEGPIIHNPIRAAADVDRVRPLDDVAPLDYVIEAVRIDPRRAAARHPLDRLRGRSVHPGLLRHRGRRVAPLRAGQDVHVPRPRGLECAAGAACRRDGPLPERPGRGRGPGRSRSSIAGSAPLSPHDYRRFVQPHMARLFRAARSVGPDDPFRHRHVVAAGAAARRGRDSHRPRLAGRARPSLGATRFRRRRARESRPGRACSRPLAEIERQARRILAQAGGRPGHIFNLGHGILPQTPVDHVRALVDIVHTISEKREASAGLTGPELHAPALPRNDPKVQPAHLLATPLTTRCMRYPSNW